MTNKYKLKCWYPSLPKNWKRLLEKDEVVVELVEHSFLLLRKPEGCGVRLNYEEVANNSEFWEKLEEKEYEIIKETYNTLIGKWEICSVKRLSDGEIFSVGDKVYNPKCPSQNFIIESFYPDCNKNHMLCGKGHVSIAKIEHCKEPILITEDGVELFEGDCFYFVDKWFGCWNGTVCDSNIRDKYKYFSTSEAAEKYLNENKPMYSKKEVIDFGGYILRNLKGVMPMKLLFELWLREKGN